jgi:hypothetical protein
MIGVARALRQLVDESAELGIVASVSYEIIRRTLKNEIRAHLVKHWVIPSRRKNAQFVWKMEAVLNPYEELYGKLPTA